MAITDVGTGNSWGLMQKIIPMGLIALFIYLGLTYLPDMITGAMGKLCAATGTGDNNLCQTAGDAVGKTLQFLSSGTGMGLIFGLIGLAVLGCVGTAAYKVHTGSAEGRAKAMSAKVDAEKWEAHQNVQRLIDDPNTPEEDKPALREQQEKIRALDPGSRAFKDYKRTDTLSRAQGDGVPASLVGEITSQTKTTSNARGNLDAEVNDLKASASDKNKAVNDDADAEEDEDEMFERL